MGWRDENQEIHEYHDWKVRVSLSKGMEFSIEDVIPMNWLALECKRFNETSTKLGKQEPLS